ncbi:hypothetical protein Trydic_g17199 [Trypoxylus dichotomus]
MKSMSGFTPWSSCRLVDEPGVVEGHRQYPVLKGHAFVHMHGRSGCPYGRCIRYNGPKYGNDKTTGRADISVSRTIFDEVLRLAHFPSKWKYARVIPIPKSNKGHHSPDGYRPISLLSTTSNVLETDPAAGQDQQLFRRTPLSRRRSVRPQNGPLGDAITAPNYGLCQNKLQQETHNSHGVSGPGEEVPEDLSRRTSKSTQGRCKRLRLPRILPIRSGRSPSPRRRLNGATRSYTSIEGLLSQVTTLDLVYTTLGSYKDAKRVTVVHRA